MGEGIRINKYLSEIGFCSRREADRLIEQGLVTINKQQPKPGEKVTQKDQVRVDGQLVSKGISTDKKDFVYLAVNKPVGIVCTTDSKNEPDNIVDYISYPKRIFPVGRLDKLSQGLIFMTSDGDIVNKILRAGNKHEKEYLVTVNRPVTQEFISKMSNGLPILGKMTRACKAVKKGTHTFEITLTEGLNRQIRRMCEYLDYRVTELQRTRIMNIKLDVPVGHYRELSKAEMTQIQQSIVDSSKTQEENPKKEKKEYIPFHKRPKPIKEDKKEEGKFKASKTKKSSGKRIGKSKPTTTTNSRSRKHGRR